MWLTISIVASSLILAISINLSLSPLAKAMFLQAKLLSEIEKKLESIRHCDASLSEYFRQEFEERREHRRSLEKLRQEEIDARIRQAAADGTLRVFED